MDMLEKLVAKYNVTILRKDNEYVVNITERGSRGMFGRWRRKQGEDLSEIIEWMCRMEGIK